MDLKKDSGNQFVYTPTQDSKLIEGNINESNPPQSPKSERNRRGKGNNNQVNFGGKQVDDHKSNKNKRNNNNNNNNQNNNSSNPNAYTPNVNMSGNAPNSPQRTRSGGGRNKGGGRVTRSQSSNMNCQIRFGQNAQPRQDQQQQQPPPQPQVTEWTGPKK
ncbi:hypothetical protein TRFO_32918 [Tritrichomonas foetus]|uniref:Uncharacterized protein n=1 Tax=Tritrichomonas foetus TaxID=1144522 RepID=A0A1J4JPS9_9EUKA|nr:hypothetical protein TRFO_32918 [Tritrichomonas foetus]|eukprot:OHT00416.1 hypothetical protein TRFO_32918 [Tritrichomonas foetus]